jgi:hypothetical protein
MAASWVSPGRVIKILVSVRGAASDQSYLRVFADHLQDGMPENVAGHANRTTGKLHRRQAYTTTCMMGMKALQASQYKLRDV